MKNIIALFTKIATYGPGTSNTLSMFRGKGLECGVVLVILRILVCKTKTPETGHRPKVSGVFHLLFSFTVNLYRSVRITEAILAA